VRRLLFFVLLSALFAGCGGDSEPIPAVCDLEPAFLDFGQFLAPLDPGDTEEVTLKFTIVNRVYTSSEHGNADLSGVISVQGPDGGPHAPEIRIVPAPLDSTFVLPPRAAKAFNLRATVRSDTEAGTFSGVVSFGTGCGDLPFVVRVYVREDTPPRLVGSFGRGGDQEGEFDRPTNLAVDRDGWVYVLEDNHDRLQIFDDTQTFWRSFEHLTDSEGRPIEGTDFSHPSDVEIGPDGNVHLADIARSRAYLFKRSGVLIKNWGSYLKPAGPAFQTPYSLAVTAQGHVLVLDTTLDRVLKFDISELQPQILLEQWGSDGAAPGQFGTISDIEIDSEGNIYLSDWEYNVVHKFTAHGQFITRWGSPGTFIGEFDRPLGLGIDADNNVYVADSRNARVQKFDSEGRFLTLWGERGIGVNQFALPYDVAVGPNGRIFVTDAGNHRVVMYENQEPAPLTSGR
jgi:DNA-binding beta-propeller fold protein YncE